MDNSSPKYFPALDGLRGLAVVLVIAFHYIAFFTPGWIGVDLFFVLSGFLITGKLLDSVSKKKYLQVFYSRRLLRIAPLYYLMLAGLFILLPLAAPQWITASYQALLGQQWAYWAFLANFQDAALGWPENITAVHFWSLACEMQFYLIWPFVILLLHRRPHTLIAILISLVLFANLFRMFAGGLYSLHTIFRYVLLPSRIDAFALGALACLNIRKRLTALPCGWILFGVAAALGAAMIAFRWHYAEVVAGGFGLTLNALFWASLLSYALTLPGSRVSVWLSCPAARQLGKYSYGLYVFHLPALVLMNKIMGDGAGGKIAALSLTCFCSIVSYHLIESKALRLKPSI